MTERLNCSNCGAPVTREGRETRVTCTHCQNVTEFPPVRSASSDDDDDDDDSGGRGGGIPNIVIIQAPPQQQYAPPPQPQVRVVHDRPVVIVRRSGSTSRYIFGPLFFILLFVGISTYIRMRAAHVAESIEKSEHAAEKAGEKPGEKPGEKKPPGHH